jgi:hypothetical protein
LAMTVRADAAKAEAIRRKFPGRIAL